MFTFLKKMIWLIIYIFMIKIVFNFKYIYTYALMHVSHAIFFNRRTWRTQAQKRKELAEEEPRKTEKKNRPGEEKEE